VVCDGSVAAPDAPINPPIPANPKPQ
jgi:hypothetical protein